VLPPFTGAAVKVTFVPWHTALGGLADMLTLTASTGFTVIVMMFEVAGLLLRQPLALDVMTQLTASPLFSDELV
jgi:hypothetical protein